VDADDQGPPVSLSFDAAAADEEDDREARRHVAGRRRLDGRSDLAKGTALDEWLNGWTDVLALFKEI
jgi:hypothetical protein